MCDPAVRVRATDEQLMSAAAEGDMDAFEQLVLRHQQGAVGVAYRLLGDHHRAQDAAQEAFLRVLESAARYRPTAGFRTYLYRILTRLCIDQYRKRSAHPSDALDRVQGSGEAPPEVLLGRERAQRVHRAVEALPSRQRVALVLQHYEGMSYEEIARVMKCSARAVDALLVRARRSLKRQLQDLL